MRIEFVNIGGEFIHQQKIFVKPIKHYYNAQNEPEYIKYGCPICESLGIKHQINKGDKNCFICNINLNWNEV